MQLTILILLRDRPMYGYEVLKELRDRFEGVWTPQTGSIYPALKKLEEHGLVISEKREGTDYYCISDEGRNWVMERLTHSPKDIRLLTRYLELLDRAAADLHIVGEGGSQPGHFSEMFEEDSCDQTRRAKKLREARDRIAQHLANIDRELEELDKENKKGGK
jgi:DNA-binding PadR family transcriptional regulator